MHILYISQHFPPEMGALSARCHELSRRWVRMGHRVSVVCGIPNHPHGEVYPGYEGRSFVHEIVDGIHVYRSWVYVTPNAGSVRRSVNYASFGLSAIAVANALDGVDVCIGSSPQLLAGFAGSVAAGMLRVPFVAEVRDLWPDSLHAVGVAVSDRQFGALRWIEHRMYRAAERVVIVSGAFRAHIESCGIDPARIAVIPNGITPDLFRDDPAAARPFDGVPADRFIVMYAGTIGMAHGLETLLDAARMLEDNRAIHFVIAGDGAERDRLHEAMRGMPNVTYLGRRPHEVVERMWRASDAGLVLLRKCELFKTVIPSKMFEVMAAGRPVVLGVEGESRRILEEARAGVAIEPGSASDLAAAVARLHAAPALCRELGAGGAAYVRRHHDLDDLAVQYESLLAAVCR